MTNKSVTKNGKKGIVDSRGRFISAGWFVYNDSKNLVRYVDSKTGKLLKNCVRWIDGKQYRFDKYGNRVNDRTSEYRRSSYYLECDRVNGVMTVYTDSTKTIPIKTIRVSVGNPITLTSAGTYTLSRSLRWQPLMGPSWGQYGTHVDGCGQGGIFVHSVACSQKNDHNLPVGEYLKLGNPASHGCIRCCVADAKWVYDNCNGSTIHIMSGTYQSQEVFKGPLGRNRLTPLRGNKTFDPTDPAYANK
nr:L,D-transpeptidase [Blautia sp. MSJ-19]